jgi:hypothetical protein
MMGNGIISSLEFIIHWMFALTYYIMTMITKFVDFLDRAIDLIEENSPYKLEFDYFKFAHLNGTRDIWYIQEMLDIELPDWVCFIFHSITGFCPKINHNEI